MRLTLMTDYALRVLMYLAEKTERLCTCPEVAQAYGISQTHLLKVMRQLGQKGWVVTVRGKGGGMRLAHAPEDIGIGKVVRDMEPDFHLVECLSAKSGCVLTDCCQLSHILDGATRHFLAHLDGFTLADLLPARSGQVLQFYPINAQR